MTWRLVRSLERLREQINAAYPGRSKASDGTIGDTAHASRKSDHNPEADGTVDAMDITHDPAHGLDIQQLADALLASRDPRIAYIICNRRIAAGRKGPSPWTWRRYRGANPHTRHLHISVLDEGQDDASPWRIDLASAKPDDSVLKKGSTGPFVRELQANLNRLGYGPLKEDGAFGAGTEKAVRAFQRSAGLEADGWAGPRTLKAIGEALAAKPAAKPQDARDEPEAPKPAPTPPRAPTAPAEGKAPENSPEPTRKDAAKELTLSKRFWTWLTTGGGTALLPFVDWRVQIIIAVAIIAFAVYAIATMPQLRRLLGLPVKGALLAAAVLPFLSDDGRTHDAPAGWAYPLSCCSGYDCREVSASAIEEGPAGYVIKATGEIIPMQDPKIRTSPDGLFHWCSKQGRDDTPTICLFVPPRGA